MKLPHWPCVLAAPLLLAAAPLFAQTCVSVEVHNVRAQQGQIMVAAYVDAESFLKKPAQSVRAPATGAITVIELCGISGNTLALTLFQDLDSDGKMGRNLLGMPTEPWGTSGTPGSFGPNWETAKVSLDGKAIVVRLSQ
jgi:uncharacterized protein (DUF2141 family)